MTMKRPALRPVFFCICKITDLLLLFSSNQNKVSRREYSTYMVIFFLNRNVLTPINS